MESSDKVKIRDEENGLNKHQSPSNSSSNGSSVTFEHPLLNPLIVDLIVEHLHPDFEQLKTLRLVSRVWTHVTLNQWRKSDAVLTLVPDPPNFTKTKYKKGVTVSRFLREFQNPHSPFQLSQKPFLKYKLKDFGLDFEECSRSQQDGMASDQFWNEIGPLMESVHFYNCKFIRPVKNPNATCPLVQFLVGMIPTIKDLGLTNVTTAAAENPYPEENQGHNSEDEDSEKPEVVQRSLFNLRSLTVYGYAEIFLRLDDLLKSAPKLEVIKGNKEVTTFLSENILGLIYEVRNYSTSLPPALSSLKHVDLINAGILADGNYNWNTRHLGRNPAPNGIPPPPLETLTLHVDANADVILEIQNLDNVLESFSRTLTTFKAFRAPVGLPYSQFLSNVSINSLKELYLLGTIAPNFGFLRSTPNLKKLKIDLSCFERRKVIKELIEEHSDDIVPWKYRKYTEDMVAEVPTQLKTEILCSKLTHLEIDYEYPEESLRMLGKWLPNLKTLKTILNGDTVPVVCKVWRDLTELVCLLGSMIEDRCFIRKEEVAGFSENPASLPKLKICGLNDLERFKLDAYCDECKLTDDVVYKGFLEMPALKYLDICVNSQMSAEAEEALRKGIPFCKVVRVDHNGCRGPFGDVFHYRCDRCGFRSDAVLHGLRDHVDEESSPSEVGEESEDDNFWGHNLRESDDNDFMRSGSGDSNDSDEIW